MCTSMAFESSFESNSGSARIPKPDFVFQKAGYLLIQNVHEKKGWNKLYFGVKDGFLIWYSSNQYTPFKRPPLGIIPLTGPCYVAIDPQDQSKTTFELTHPEIYQCYYYLKANTAEESERWVTALNNAKKACWENAQLGFSTLEYYRNKEQENAKEMQEALKELERQAEELNRQNRDKLRIVEREKKTIRPLKEQVEKTDADLNEYLQEMENIEEAIKKEEKILKRSHKDRKKLEDKLRMARMAMKRLEEALQFELNIEENQIYDQMMQSHYVARSNSSYGGMLESSKSVPDTYQRARNGDDIFAGNHQNFSETMSVWKKQEKKISQAERRRIFEIQKRKFEYPKPKFDPKRIIVGKRGDSQSSQRNIFNEGSVNGNQRSGITWVGKRQTLRFTHDKKAGKVFAMDNDVHNQFDKIKQFFEEADSAYQRKQEVSIGKKLNRLRPTVRKHGKGS